MKFQSKFLVKAFGLDQSGDTVDQQQDNVRDKNNDVRNPGKVDENPANAGRDCTTSLMEQEQVELAHDSINPHVPPPTPMIPPQGKGPFSAVSLQG